MSSHSYTYARPVPSTGQAVEALLVSFPVVCFTLALVTDIIYWRTSFLMWQHFSEWLLLAGLVVGALAVIARLIGIFARSEHRAPRFWPYAIGCVLVLVLALVNSLVHSGDGWTAVVPRGLILSTVTVLVMLITGWLGIGIFGRRAGDRRYG